MARCIDCTTTHSGWEAEERDAGISDGESKEHSPAPPPTRESEQSLGKSCKSTELLSWWQLPVTPPTSHPDWL